LWALRTNTNRATRDTPFHLVYGADIVLPLELYLGSVHVAQFSEADQQEARELDVDLMEEERNSPSKYQESLKHHYSKKVVIKTLVDDLVLKKDIRTTEKHKFSSPWEGPYIIVKIATPGTYILAKIEGNILKNTWNADQLCKYYV
jgi:hypothetical protein